MDAGCAGARGCGKRRGEGGGDAGGAKAAVAAGEGREGRGFGCAVTTNNPAAPPTIADQIPRTR